MEDSLKGILVSVTIISIFITCILNFIVLFPQEQGVSFTGESQTNYLVISNNTKLSTQTQLNLINNQTAEGFNQWDITQGFMGSNSIKQSTQTGIKDYSLNIFSTLKIISTQIFGAGSYVLVVIAILLSLTTAYLVYVVIKFVRTGS